MTAVALSQDLLDRLEAVWRRQRAPLVERLRPGLSDAEMDALTAPLGVRLTPEARLWWGWHDGVDGDGDNWILARGWGYISLAQAVAGSIDTRDTVTGDPGRHEDEWPASWVAWCAERGYLALECADPEAELTPVHAHFWHLGREYQAGTPSMGTAVTWWIEALESGAASHDPATGWQYDYEALPPDRGFSRIV